MANRIPLEIPVKFDYLITYMADKEIHPLKRKSIKPSSSTVRGMLPGPQFRSLDAAMQNLRSAGLRLDWIWKSKSLGWVCGGLVEDTVICELRPTLEPFVGVVILPKAARELAIQSSDIPESYKRVLGAPMDETKNDYLYEFVLETTQFRDLLSNFVEALVPVMEEFLKQES